jgi:hypothetical protein
MSAHRRKYADQRVPTTDADRRSAARADIDHLRLKGARKPGFIPPFIEQNSLTSVLLTIIVVLVALNFMLRFPELGAVIAQYNQF